MTTPLPPDAPTVNVVTTSDPITTGPVTPTLGVPATVPFLTPSTGIAVPAVLAKLPGSAAGLRTTELIVFAIVAAVATITTVAVLIWSPNASDRALLSGYITKLVGVAVAYILSRGLAKAAQGVAPH